MIGREGWKEMIVSKFMYGYGALAWYQQDCDVLDVDLADGYGKCRFMLMLLLTHSFGSCYCGEEGPIFPLVVH